MVTPASAVCKRVAERLNINGARPVREHSSPRDTLHRQHCRCNKTTEHCRSSFTRDQSKVKMVKYTLVYFDGRGRAEVCRILFALADVEYEDKRIQGADWGKLKPETPFGQMPILKFDDITLCQSDAMEFYLAKTFGFAGSNTLEEAQVLMMGACVLDTLTPLFKMYGLKEEEAKDEIRKKYETEQMPKFLGNLQKMLVSNKGGDGYFIGDKVIATKRFCF
ncbi:S-crystallin SL11 [Lamellibrachia satsuma]|nr:S-crystallin SL11 [Lamellibrachia satsuma]